MSIPEFLVGSVSLFLTEVKDIEGQRYCRALDLVGLGWSLGSAEAKQMVGRFTLNPGEGTSALSLELSVCHFARDGFWIMISGLGDTRVFPGDMLTQVSGMKCLGDYEVALFDDKMKAVSLSELVVPFTVYGQDWLGVVKRTGSSNLVRVYSVHRSSMAAMEAGVSIQSVEYEPGYSASFKSSQAHQN